MSRIRIFDTTLRDGEQSPGVNLNKMEKLEIAKQLETLGVDVMEAGFPAASEGDFQAVKLIADTIKDVSVTALARTRVEDIEYTAPKNPYIPGNLPDPHDIQAEDDTGTGDPAVGGYGEVRQGKVRGSGMVRRRCDTFRVAFPGPGDRTGHRSWSNGREPSVRPRLKARSTASANVQAT